jgi:hypothetical protein
MAYNGAVSEPPPAWSREGIDAVLEFLDNFEDPNFVAAVWYPPIKSIIDGQEVTHMPYPTYSDRFEESGKPSIALVASFTHTMHCPRMRRTRG